MAATLLGAEALPTGKMGGDIGTVRWILQFTQHRVVSHDLFIVVENKSPTPILARLMWTPVRCGDVDVPLDPFVEPRLIDLAGDLPKTFVLEPGSWRAATYPIGIPVVAGSLPRGDPKCSTEVVVILSTKAGQRERWTVTAPIDTPEERDPSR
jgi:hypothetical protein